MKQVVVIKQVNSFMVDEIKRFQSKKEAEHAMSTLFGWKKCKNLSIPTWRGCICNDFGQYVDVIATMYSNKEWEACMKYAY